MSKPPEIPSGDDLEAVPVDKGVEAFFQGTDFILAFSDKVLIPVLRGQLSLSDREKAIVGTYYRIHLWLRSLICLNAPQHFQAIAVGVRSLYELGIDLELLAINDKRERLAKFFAFTQVERFRAAKKLVDYCDSHEACSNIENAELRAFQAEASVRAIVDAARKLHWPTLTEKKKYPQHWTGLSISQRAELAGADYQEIYVELFPLLSWYVHSGFAGIAGLSPDAFKAMVARAHGVAQRIALRAIRICGCEMKVPEAYEPFYRVLDMLNIAPGAILAGKQVELLRCAIEKE
jgi:hypothetical protein